MNKHELKSLLENIYVVLNEDPQGGHPEPPKPGDRGTVPKPDPGPGPDLPPDDPAAIGEFDRRMRRLQFLRDFFNNYGISSIDHIPHGGCVGPTCPGEGKPVPGITDEQWYNWQQEWLDLEEWWGENVNRQEDEQPQPPSDGGGSG